MKDAASFRVRKSLFYEEKSGPPFEISISKLSNFLSYKKCFYLDGVVGLKELSMPSCTFNSVEKTIFKEIKCK